MQNKMIDKDIIDYIAQNVRSNVRDLEASLTKLISYSELLGQELTMEKAKELLSVMPVNDKSADAKEFTYQTEVFTITFDPKGAAVSSIKLNKHTTNGQPVELLFKGNTGKDAFLMYAGNDKTKPINAVFNHTVNGNKVIFTQKFVTKGTEEPFTITKTYTFGPSDYLFEINVAIDNSVNKAIPLSFDNNAYTMCVHDRGRHQFRSLIAWLNPRRLPGHLPNQTYAQIMPSTHLSLTSPPTPCG